MERSEAKVEFPAPFLDLNRGMAKTSAMRLARAGKRGDKGDENGRRQERRERESNGGSHQLKSPSLKLPEILKVRKMKSSA